MENGDSIFFIEENSCRICLQSDNSNENKLLDNVCGCSGSMKYVHERCINTWIRISKNDTCEVCDCYYNEDVIRRRIDKKCFMIALALMMHFIFDIIILLYFLLIR